MKNTVQKYQPTRNLLMAEETWKNRNKEVNLKEHLIPLYIWQKKNSLTSHEQKPGKLFCPNENLWVEPLPELAFNSNQMHYTYTKKAQSLPQYLSILISPETSSKYPINTNTIKLFLIHAPIIVLTPCAIFSLRNPHNFLNT